MNHPAVAWKPFAPKSDVASVRVRCQVPQQILAAKGWAAEMFAESSADRYDIVVFQKAYTTHDLALARTLSRRGKRIVFDLCDNHFYNPEHRPDLAERADRLRQMVDLADAVTISAPRLADVVEKDRVFVVDDALDPVGGIPDTRARWPRLRGRDRIRLAWFGNAGSDVPPFGLIDLGRIVPELNRLHSRRPIDIAVVTNSKSAYKHHLTKAEFPTRYIRWTPTSFRQTVSTERLSLVPISINPFTICKTSNRVVTALMSGSPVIADQIPSYEEFAPYVLVADWETSIERYARDPDLRHEHVRSGQAFIRQRFAPDVIAEQWTHALESVLG